MNSKFPVTATISYTNTFPRMVANVFANYFPYFFVRKAHFQKTTLKP